MIKSRVPLVAMLTALLLTGCAATPPTALVSSTPTETATPSPTPSPTPTATLTAITIGGQSAAAIDQNGNALAQIDYSAPDPATIETLTALFGFEPTREEVRRGAATDAFVGTVYTWEAFSIGWRGKWDDTPGSGFDLSVSASAPSVRGVILATADGFAVGQQGDLAARFPDASYTGSTRDGVSYTQAWIGCIPIDIPDAADCVALYAQPSDGPITAVAAPYALNHGL